MKFLALLIALTLLGMPSLHAIGTPSEFIEYLHANGVQYDDASRLYRNGRRDPKIDALPEAMLGRALTEPSTGLPPLVAWLMVDARDEYQKVKRIYDFIGQHIAYDFDLYAGRVKGRRDWEGVLLNQRTTCGGFSALFARMAELAGLEVKVIRGLSKYLRTLKRELADHAWNGVRIDGRWYIVDATGGSVNYWEYGKKGTRLMAYSDAYLLLRPEAYLLWFYPDDTENLHTVSCISRETVYATPMLWLEAFDYGVKIDPSGLGFALASDGQLNMSPLGALMEAFDTVQSGKAISIPIELSGSEDVRIFVTMKGFETDGYFLYAGIGMQDKTKLHAHFSPPAPGDYECFIFVQNVRTEGWHVVYRFVFRYSGPGGEAAVLPASTRLPMVNGNVVAYGLDPSDFIWSPPVADGIARLRIRLPEGLEAIGVGLSADGAYDIAGIEQRVTELEGRRYVDMSIDVTNSRPFLKVFAKRSTDPGYAHPVFSARLR